jgi:dTDP-4-amino-4,6-dideoxygalactose transaminase
MILTNDENLAKKAKHITTTAKIPHRWDFEHNQIAYNYRLPNINAALGCAQMEALLGFLEKKRCVAEKYSSFFEDKQVSFVREPENTKSNYWLNAILTNDRSERDMLLAKTNENGVMTRPIWKLMNHLPMFKNAQSGNLENALWLEERTINIPSSVVIS